MSEEYKAKLAALLQAYAERAAKEQRASTSPKDLADRRMCGERLRSVVRPVLDAIMVELKNPGHDASVREHIEPDRACPRRFPHKRAPRSGATALAAGLGFRARSRTAGERPYGAAAPRRARIPQRSRRDIRLRPNHGRRGARGRPHLGVRAGL